MLGVLAENQRASGFGADRHHLASDAVYETLDQARPMLVPDSNSGAGISEANHDLASLIGAVVESAIKSMDSAQKDDEQRDMGGCIPKRNSGYHETTLDARKLAQRIVDLAKVRPGK